MESPYAFLFNPMKGVQECQVSPIQQFHPHSTVGVGSLHLRTYPADQGGVTLDFHAARAGSQTDLRHFVSFCTSSRYPTGPDLELHSFATRFVRLARADKLKIEVLDGKRNLYLVDKMAWLVVIASEQDLQQRVPNTWNACWMPTRSSERSCWLAVFRRVGAGRRRHRENA
jgi:hypothetical protein